MTSVAETREWRYTGGPAQSDKAWHGLARKRDLVHIVLDVLLRADALPLVLCENCLLARLVSRVLRRGELARHPRKVRFARGRYDMRGVASMSMPTTGTSCEVETPVGGWVSGAMCRCGTEARLVGQGARRET